VLLAKDRPQDAIRHLAPGITSPAFILQAVVSLVVLWVLTAGMAAYLRTPRNFEISRALANFVWLAVECGASAAMIGLLCVMLKRDAKPLGAVEGVAAVRVLSLGLMLPVVIGLVIAMLLLYSPEAGVPGIVSFGVRWGPRLWAFVNFTLQAVLLVGLLGRASWVPIFLSFVFCYGTATLASQAAALLG
jgi:hypothetical protein